MTFFVQQYTGKKNYQRFLYETHMLYALWHVFWYKKAEHEFVLPCLSIIGKPSLQCRLSCLLFQAQSVGNQRDKFRVGWLALVVIDGIAKKRVNGVHLPAVPCHFDSMADSAFHSGRSCIAFFCDGGIELFCNIIQDVHVVYAHNDGFAHVVVAADMRGDTDFMQDIRDLCFQVI